MIRDSSIGPSVRRSSFSLLHWSMRFIIISSFLLAVTIPIASAWYLKRVLSTSAPSNLLYAVRPSGYVPPELDPEYRKNTIFTKPSSKKEDVRPNVTSLDATEILPLPKEGDIVLFKGRWADEQIGRIRFLQYVAAYETFFADIVPLIEGKSENVYILDRNSNAEYIRVDEIKPVRFYFVRAENGYKVYKDKKNPQKIVLRARSYGPIDKDYNFRSKVRL